MNAGPVPRPPAERASLFARPPSRSRVGSGGMRVAFSKHACQRMDEMGVPMRDVVEALQPANILCRMPDPIEGRTRVYSSQRQDLFFAIHEHGDHTAVVSVLWHTDEPFTRPEHESDSD